MGAFHYYLNNCTHCGKPRQDLIKPPPILDQEKLDASTSSKEHIRPDDRVSVGQAREGLQK